uniref:Uncharacterized protein n=1 Tax=Auxenochlorella protothecoides TaxID=3075 RepID=A0A1D1ZU66_AUXPR
MLLLPGTMPPWGGLVRAGTRCALVQAPPGTRLWQSGHGLRHLVARNAPSGRSARTLRIHASENGGDPILPPVGKGAPGLVRVVLKGALKILGSVVLFSSLVLGSAPYLLSTKFGLETALFAANVAMPATLSVDGVSAGWGRPLSIHGIVLSEEWRSAGPRQDRQAGEETGLAPPGAQRPLLQIERVTSSAPLHSLLTSRAPLTLTVHRPVADATLGPDGTLRLLGLLERCGLLRSPAPLQAVAPADLLCGAGEGKATRATADLKERVVLARALGGAPAAQAVRANARAAAGGQRQGGSHDDTDAGSGNSKDSAGDQAQQHDPEAAEVKAAAFGWRQATRRFRLPALEEESSAGRGSERRPLILVRPEGAAAPAPHAWEEEPANKPLSLRELAVRLWRGREGRAQREARARRSRGAVPPALQRADAAVAFSGELVTPWVHCQTADGALNLPLAFKEAAGEHVHMEVLQGLAALEEAGKDGVGEDLAWAQRRPQMLLPLAAGRPQLPTSIRVDSRVAHGTLRGWTTSQGYTLLTAPLELALECLPPLARRLLARLNPLLGATLTLGPEDRPLAVRLSVVPQDALLPAAACLVRVDPLEVTLSSSGALLEPLARLRSLGGAVPRLPERVSAGVSGLEAVVDDGGGLTAAALDLTLMLPARTRVGLTTWGSAALHHPERLDWVVAVPGATLQALGVRGVEEDRGVAMLVTGSPLAPTPQLARFGADLARVIVTQAAGDTLRSKRSPLSVLPDWLAQHVSLGLEGDAAQGTVQLPPPSSQRDKGEEKVGKEEDSDAS